VEPLHLGLGETESLSAGRIPERGLLVNPTCLIPVTQSGDLQQDRVG
jgi:hypothetical protein